MVTVFELGARGRGLAQQMSLMGLIGEARECTMKTQNECWVICDVNVTKNSTYKPIGKVRPFT